MDYAVTGDQLSAIADAIRLKTDNPAQMSVDDMPLQIGLIPTGGGSSQNIKTGTIVGDGLVHNTSNPIVFDVDFEPKTVIVQMRELDVLDVGHVVCCSCTRDYILLSCSRGANATNYSVTTYNYDAPNSAMTMYDYDAINNQQKLAFAPAGRVFASGKTYDYILLG